MACPVYLHREPAENHSPDAWRPVDFFVAASRFQPLVLIGLGVIRLLRAMKNLSGISGVIRLNEQIKRPQATRNRRKHRPSISIRSRFIHAKETSELNPVFYWNL